MPALSIDCAALLTCQSGEKKLKYLLPIKKEQLKWIAELNLESLVLEDSWLLMP